MKPKGEHGESGHFYNLATKTAFAEYFLNE